MSKKKIELKKQYLLKIQFANQVEKGEWYIGARLDPSAKPLQRFYDSLEDAKAALNRLTEEYNQEHVYDENGKRRETHSIGGGFAADMVYDKQLDDMHRIVNWSIQVREVTPWEVVENSK